MKRERPYEPFTFADRAERERCRDILQPLFDRFGTRTKEQRTDLKHSANGACPYPPGGTGRRIFEDVFGRLMTGDSVFLADEPEPKASEPELQYSLF